MTQGQNGFATPHSFTTLRRSILRILLRSAVASLKWGTSIYDRQKRDYKTTKPADTFTHLRN
jgi:hypothetical protein